MIEYAPVALGVPDNTPSLDKLNPAGSAPPLTLQLYGVRPPVASSCSEYAALTVASGNEAVVITRGSASPIVIPRLFVTVCANAPPASVTATDIAYIPFVVGTPLIAHLTQLGVQTLIICGESTSGCVRATAVDAYSMGFHVVLVEECCFDRSILSHKVNLFDMHHKYVDVMHVDEVVAHLDGLAVRKAS